MESMPSQNIMNLGAAVKHRQSKEQIDLILPVSLGY